MLIDTHCHLHDLEWFTPEQQTDFLKNAHNNGVEKIICIGTNHEDSLHARDFATERENIYWTYGIHPEFANKISDVDQEVLLFGEMNLFDRETVPQATAEEEAARARNDGTRERRVSDQKSSSATEEMHRLVAIGEIGLDYHYDGYDRPAQIKLFEQMLQLSLDLGLPVSLHLREAFDDAFAVLDNFPKAHGVVHSFTGSKRDLKKALERGFYIGVNGLVTYTTPPLPPLERILLETDAPFLTPVPFRGTINKPGYVKQIAAYLATKLEVTELEIAEQTTKNARQIFKI